MIPGPDQVIACPHCKGLARYHTLLSGNTCGATVWSDGKRIAPMLPQPPQVVKCAHCRECYWLASAEKLGTFSPWDWGEGPTTPREWQESKPVEEPTELEYLSAITKLAKDREEERSVRLLAWWRRNDSFRQQNEADVVIARAASGETRNNLLALLPLLDEEDENDCVMKSEVLRELGELDRSRELLKRISTPGLAGVVRQLREWCDRGVTTVQALRFN
jgi:hypothetical protein